MFANYYSICVIHFRHKPSNHLRKKIFLAWRSVSPTWESPSDLGFDMDYNDEQQDDDDTSADDSVYSIYSLLLSEKFRKNSKLSIVFFSFCIHLHTILFVYL